jgi:GGDEF domain-containing protein
VRLAACCCSKIQSALDAYNKTSDKPYQLRCSIGSELYETSDNIEDMMEDVDKMMYEQKRRKRLNMQ